SSVFVQKCFLCRGCVNFFPLQSTKHVIGPGLQRNLCISVHIIYTISKKKKKKKNYYPHQTTEVDALLSENEMLQGKLHSQEDDFRLQNSTLMQELSKLCSQIERLELENQGLKDGKGLSAPAPSPVSGPTDGELLRLQAENSALQKKLHVACVHVLTDCFKHYLCSLYSFLRLQGEKEALYNDSRTKIEEIQQRKEEELKSINLRVQKLQNDLMTANQNVAELKEQLQSKQKEHEMALLALKDQIQTVKTQELSLLRDQNMALNVELQQRRTEQDSLLAQKDDLSSQLQEANRANNRLLEQISELGLDKDKLQQELEEAKKTADKRKAMLDELAIETAQEKSRHKEELSDLRLQHEKEVLSVRARYEKELRGLHEEKNRTEEEIRAQLRDEKARTKELEGLQQSVEELQAQVQSMEGTKGWFERRLKEAEETMEKNSQEHTEEIQRLQREHTQQLEVKQGVFVRISVEIGDMMIFITGINNVTILLSEHIMDIVSTCTVSTKNTEQLLFIC
uniref:GRIP1 associated protein 1 n=1 Tax=Pygocentrus nattereri TaxID=42514 RepID=A0AAR2LI97_PYGNA